MPIANIDEVKVGDKISYQDMANPYQEFLVVMTPEDMPNEWGYKEFRVRDEQGKHHTKILGQYGWNHHPQVKSS